MFAGVDPLPGLSTLCATGVSLPSRPGMPEGDGAPPSSARHCILTLALREPTCAPLLPTLAPHRRGGSTLRPCWGEAAPQPPPRPRPARPCRRPLQWGGWGPSGGTSAGAGRLRTAEDRLRTASRYDRRQACAPWDPGLGMQRVQGRRPPGQPHHQLLPLQEAKEGVRGRRKGRGEAWASTGNALYDSLDAIAPRAQSEVVKGDCEVVHLDLLRPSPTSRGCMPVMSVPLLEHGPLCRFRACGVVDREPMRPTVVVGPRTGRAHSSGKGRGYEKTWP
jgi:hypothetical protein